VRRLILLLAIVFSVILAFICARTEAESLFYNFEGDIHGFPITLATLELTSLPATHEEVVGLTFTSAGQSQFGYGETYPGTFDISDGEFVSDGEGGLTCRSCFGDRAIQDTDPPPSSVSWPLTAFALGVNNPFDNDYEDFIERRLGDTGAGLYWGGTWRTAPPPLPPGENLHNSGFERQIDYVDPEAHNWFAFCGGGCQGTTSTINRTFSDPIMPNEGSHHLSIINGGEADGFSGVYQNVAVAGGTDYTFGLAAKQNGPIFNISAEFRIEWYDTIDNLIGRQFDLNTPIEGLTQQYQDYSLTATAPADAVRATAVIAVQTFIPPPPGGAGDFFGQLYVDSTFFAVSIPEPSAILLALVGIYSAMILRRSL
jgi:hypothetical protein